VKVLDHTFEEYLEIVKAFQDSGAPSIINGKVCLACQGRSPYL
jgi:hypothetical protein